MSAASTITPPGPGPGPEPVISLASWTWPGPDQQGRSVAHILLTHTPGAGRAETEVRIRRLAGGLGVLAGRQDAIPDIGPCLQVIDGHVLLSFPGRRRQLWLPTRPAWTELVARSGEAVLLIGFDPLPQSADAARLGDYLDAAVAADRLLFGVARTR